MLNREVNDNLIYSGQCEYPGCTNKLITRSKTRKYCTDHRVMRYKNSSLFKRGLND